jgi:hypothetical protein
MEHFCFNDQFGENWFSFSKLYSEMVKHFPDGSHFIEIGSWKGRSATYLAVEIINSQKNIKFDCIDIWENSHFYSEKMVGQGYPTFSENLYQTFLNNITPVSHIINPVQSDSSAAAKTYADNSVNFIFIDGDHSYEGIKRDLECWLPKIKDGGIIAGHDYHYDPIKRAVKEIFGISDYSDPWGNGCFIAKVNTNYERVFKLKQLFDQGRYSPESHEELENLKTDYKKMINSKIEKFTGDAT